MIEQAIPKMRRWPKTIYRCKKRYYCMIDHCLYRIYINEFNQPKILGVANLSGADFITDAWQETTLKLVED